MNYFNTLIAAAISLLMTGVSFGQSCDTLRNYSLTDDFYEISGPNGAALGHDKLNDGMGGTTNITAWAEPYTVTASTEVRRLRFLPWLVHDEGGSVTFNVYDDDNAGRPGTILDSETVPISDFTENTFYELDFLTPAIVNGNFFVGFELTYNVVQDSFAIIGTHKPGGFNFTELYFDGAWDDVDNIYTIGADPYISAWRLDVLCSNAPDPIGDFTVDGFTACIGSDFNMDASASQNTDQYLWFLTGTGATPIYDTDEGVNGTVTSTTVGNDQEVILLADGGCRTDAIGYIIDVFSSVSATVGVQNTTCGLDNGQINITSPAGGSGSYSYSIDNGNSFQSNGIYTGLSSGIYNVVVVTGGNGCSYTETINVGSSSRELISVGADVAICENDNAIITASGAGTIEWFDGLTSLGNGTSLSVNPSATTIYDAVLTDVNGCEDSDQVTVTVNQLPTVIASGVATICAGSPTTISATGASSYTWDNGLGNGASQIVSPNTTTIYEVTGSSAAGCENTDQVTINVNALPAVSAGADVSICDGLSTTITATGAVSYTWDNSLGAGASHTVNPSTTSVYEVTGVDANNCENTAVVEVTVNPIDDPSFDFNNYCEVATSNGPTNITTAGGTFSFNPVPTDGATIDGTSGEITDGVTGSTYSVEYVTNGLCPSSSIETVSVQSNDDPSFNYTDICLGNGIPIEPSNIATSNGTFDFVTVPTDGASIDGNTGVISGAVQGSSYDVEYTTPTGVCQASSVATVQVFNAPTITAVGAQTICEQDIATLNATGADTYFWDNGIGAGDVQVVSPSSTTTYEVTGTIANGCTNTDNVTVTVNPLPSINAGGDQEVCEGETVNISASGANSYSWDNGLGAGATHSFAATATITYIVTGTDGNNCSNTDDVVITVNTLPVLDAGADQDICSGEQTTISASGANTYAWSNGLGAGAAHNVSPTSTSLYEVIGTDLNGCENSDQIIVTVNAIPAINAGVDQLVCEGEEVTLAASVSGGTISWDNSVTDGVAFTASTTTTYTATADDNGCTSTDDVVVTVNPLPLVSIGNDETTCANYDPIQLAGSPSGGAFGGPGVSGNEFDPGTAGIGVHTLSYTYQDANGCENSATQVITVDGCASIDEEQAGFNLYPNPAHTYFEVESSIAIEEVKMISALGQEVNNLPIEMLGQNKIKVTTINLNRGTYFVQIKTASDVFTQKVIIH